MKYVDTKEACRVFGVHANPLRNWDRSGKIKTSRTPGRVRLYNLITLETNKRSRIVYARVSSNGQKEDLSKQIEYLFSSYKV